MQFGQQVIQPEHIGSDSPTPTNNGEEVRRRCEALLGLGRSQWMVLMRLLWVLLLLSARGPMIIGVVVGLMGAKARELSNRSIRGGRGGC